MKRHRCASGLCFFGRRSVSATQIGFPICVMANWVKKDSIRGRIVFSGVAHPVLMHNDPLIIFLLIILNDATQFYVNESSFNFPDRAEPMPTNQTYRNTPSRRPLNVFFDRSIHKTLNKALVGSSEQPIRSTK